MITEKKLAIYSEYGGDIDSWMRFGSEYERKIIQNEDWGIIESLIQDIRVEINQLAGKEYSKKFENKLVSLCGNEETVKRLVKIAENNSY